MGSGGEGGEGEGAQISPGLIRAYLGSPPLPSLTPSPHESLMGLFHADAQTLNLTDLRSDLTFWPKSAS